VTTRKPKRRKSQTLKNVYRQHRQHFGVARLLAHLFFGGLAVAAMSAVLIFGHDLLTQCDFFKARQIQISGLHQVSRQEVIRLGRIGPEANILAVNLKLVRQRLLSHPYIAEASVGRQMPDRLIIRVKEHSPVAILDLGRRFLVNAKGDIFKEMESADPQRLPRIVGLDFSDISVGDMPRSRAYEAVLEVLELGRQPQSAIPLGQIRRIEVDRDIGLTVFAQDRIGAVKIGYNDYASKFRILKRVMHYLERDQKTNRFRSIDLHNLNRIIADPFGSANGKEV
jgi:cell division protein FtsQ